MTALLDLESVDVHYGDFQAIHGVSLSLDEGETLAVMGANGAGKSTLLKAVAGLMATSAGAVRFGGQDLAGMAPHQRVAAGISLVPEGRRVFKSLTVEENLLVGGYSGRPGPWDLAAVFKAFPLLAERRSRTGIHLSGGEQQATAIGRALMANPRLLLLDEVSLGLAPVVVKDIYQALPVISSRGTTVLIVEQDVSQALSVADHVQCLLEGRTVLEASAASVTRDDVAAAYFGLEAR
ncbi:ABC transporter ATP-binding protein [Aeromicrobium wangtongii]|uniref:ABC transporter ATP-binding protein n=1 Tax=Aeromicrobium wangtongii TaxID=2969247 RepID=A0ABY5M762_9ACTN|nr:ABC transporter ATP-binding protein [Aeromicrobium wangtongii]MCD9199078.1 ABC transporter ATP-binding protein [Aeromicrobium wangtongii]UUP12891.1 ABC transporter ATP-binding protein [Aeromicrobium wangtongii]